MPLADFQCKDCGREFVVEEPDAQQKTHLCPTARAITSSGSAKRKRPLRLARVRAERGRTPRPWAERLTLKRGAEASVCREDSELAAI